MLGHLLASSEKVRSLQLYYLPQFHKCLLMYEIINILTTTAALYTYLNILLQQWWALMSQKFTWNTFHHLKQTFAQILHNQGKKGSHKQSTLRGRSLSFKVNRHFVTKFDGAPLLLRLALKQECTSGAASLTCGHTRMDLCSQEKPCPCPICTGQSTHTSHGVHQSSCPREHLNIHSF